MYDQSTPDRGPQENEDVVVRTLATASRSGSESGVKVSLPRVKFLDGDYVPPEKPKPGYRPQDSGVIPVDFSGRSIYRKCGAKMKPKAPEPKPAPDLKRDILAHEQEPVIPEPAPEPGTRDWMVIQTMNDLFQDRPPEIVPDRSGEVLSIVSIVCDASGLTKMELIGESRRQKYAKWRHVAAYLLLKHRGLTLPAVGRILGGRDHSTIHHSVSKIESNMADYRLMLKAVEDRMADHHSQAREARS